MPAFFHCRSKGLILPIIAVLLGEVAALNALAFGYEKRQVSSLYHPAAAHSHDTSPSTY
jgi:hypothetical protein